MANPNKLDWLHYQDIQIPDTNLQTQFNNYFNNGQYVEALSILKSNEEQLKGKEFIADAINKIVTAIYTMEKEYDDNIVLFLNNLGIQFQNVINSIRNAGQFRESINYIPYNACLYLDDIYLNIKEGTPAGTLPTNTTYWLKLGLKGEKGNFGINVNPRYKWTPATDYRVNDVVGFKDSLYVAIRNNKNAQPDISTSDWIVFLKTIRGGIHVGTTPPTKFMHNTVWLQLDEKINPLLDANTIGGQFKRYNGVDKVWEEMYPTTMQMMVDNILAKPKVLNVSIEAPSEKKEYIFYDNAINPRSIIKLKYSSIIPPPSGLIDKIKVNPSYGKVTLSNISSNASFRLKIIIQ